MTEAELIKGCIRKNAACEKELFERYAGRMLGVCHRYARNTEDAEDILQDGFIKVFNKIGQYKSEGSFEGWIRKIMVNTALKKYTVSRYHKEFATPEIKENAQFSADAHAYGQLSEKDLMQLINGLPDGYRIIFNMYVIEGYQHEEISGMLGIQPGTSRSQLVKARQMLQKQLEQLQKVAV